jgi:cAMP-binding proteins - catabolite gene activator and regulatory subunit of cAMP-dependent protein kinases
MDGKSLKGIPLFADLPPKDLKQVARWMDVVNVSAGNDLLEEGAMPHEFFVMLEGEADVRHDGELLAHLASGDFFGEIALVETNRRTATVTTATPARLAVMHSRDFAGMRVALPKVADRIEAAILARMPPGTGVR